MKRIWSKSRLTQYIATAMLFMTPLSIIQSWDTAPDDVPKTTTSYASTLCMTMHGDSVELETKDPVCKAFLDSGLGKSAKFVGSYTPILVSYPNALYAASEFTTMNGVSAYVDSPMAKFFQAKKIGQGCAAFDNYLIYGLFEKKPFLLSCVPYREHAADPTSWVCKVPSLVRQRKRERAICDGTYGGI